MRKMMTANNVVTGQALNKLIIESVSNPSPFDASQVSDDDDDDDITNSIQPNFLFACSD
jgi:hypothetical protein